MKRILLSVFAIVLSFGAFAQQTTAPKDTITTPEEARGQKVFLKYDGKMYIVNEGVKTELTKDVILSNETVVTTIGQVKDSDGSTVTLEDNQYVNQKGEVGEWK
jgi:hypothetical protein